LSFQLSPLSNPLWKRNLIKVSVNLFLIAIN
jgi:hypothetical protein